MTKGQQGLFSKLVSWYKKPGRIQDLADKAYRKVETDPSTMTLDLRDLGAGKTYSWMSFTREGQRRMATLKHLAEKGNKFQEDANKAYLKRNLALAGTAAAGLGTAGLGAYALTRKRKK